MTTWVLIFYMSVGWGQASTGGPSTIDGFSSLSSCEVALKEVRKVDKVDSAQCMKVVK